MGYNITRRSVEERIGNCMTAGAVIVILGQVAKQAKIERAINIENKRPAFNRFYAPRKPADGKVIFKYGNDKIIDYYLKSFPCTPRVLAIKNISENTALRVDVCLEYFDKRDCQSSTVNEPLYEVLTYQGFMKEQSILLGFTSFIENREITVNNLIVIFMSSQNEMGFVKYNNYSRKKGEFLDIGKYFFVKGRNSVVELYGNDKLISEDSIVYQSLNSNFDNLSEIPHTNWC